jgi:glutamate/aspartate transport system substrate-binding protein
VIGTTRTPLLLNGATDINCATTTNTLTRQRQVDFFDTMFITGNRILTKKGSGIHDIEDLKGKRVTVNQGTTNAQIIKALDAKLNLGIRFLDTKDQPQGWLALETGRSDAHVTDEVVEYGLIAKAKSPEQYEVVGRLLSYDSYAILIRREDSAFRLVGNRALVALFRSDEINAIYDKGLLPITCR